MKIHELAKELDMDAKEVLEKAQNKKVVDNNRFRQLLKGRVKHEEKTGK